MLTGFEQVAAIVGHSLRQQELLTGLPAAAELLETQPSDFNPEFPPVTPRPS
jgi:hypothetical protein